MGMEKTKVLATTIEMARAGLGFTPAAALAYIAELIEREDAQSGVHDRNVEQLLRLGSCIWALRHGIFVPTAPRANPGAASREVDERCTEQA